MKKSQQNITVAFHSAIKFFKEALRTKGLSDNLVWIFRENITAPRRSNFMIHVNLGVNDLTDKKIDWAYRSLQEGGLPIIFFAFYSDPNRTIVTITGDDYDYEEGDDFKYPNAEIFFILSGYLTKNEVEFVTDSGRWEELQNLEAEADRLTREVIELQSKVNSLENKANELQTESYRLRDEANRFNDNSFRLKARAIELELKVYKVEAEQHKRSIEMINLDKNLLGPFDFFYLFQELCFT